MSSKITESLCKALELAGGSPVETRRIVHEWFRANVVELHVMDSRTRLLDGASSFQYDDYALKKASQMLGAEMREQGLIRSRAYSRHDLINTEYSVLVLKKALHD